MRALLLSMLMLLAGCVADNPPDPYRVAEAQHAIGTWCRARVQPYGVEYAPTDSLAACADGSAPRLFDVEYFSPNRSCVVTELHDVVGGFAGIKRIFGCKK